MKIGDSIKSIKPGNLNGFIGDILSIDTEHKRVTAISKDSGTWRFGFDEILPLGKESQAEPLKKPIVDKLPFEIDEKPKQIKLKMTSVNGSTIIKEKGSKNKVENLEVAPTKRAYNRKAKDQQTIKKEKRPYNKKVKS
jgi:hypothetical protein